jgi:hypothetical protein
MYNVTKSSDVNLSGLPETISVYEQLHIIYMYIMTKDSFETKEYKRKVKEQKNIKKRLLSSIEDKALPHQGFNKK